MLTRAASGWRATLRAEEQLARIGGDEFVVILPDTNAAAARRTLDRLTAATPGVSAAVGSAEWDHQQSAVELLAAADAAMYAHKRGA
jgi:diguanylate cyclase (GGDEF)-like protein